MKDLKSFDKFMSLVMKNSPDSVEEGFFKNFKDFMEFNKIIEEEKKGKEEDKKEKDVEELNEEEML